MIPLMAEGKILPYLDIPFQHSSPRILKLMKRPAASAKTLERMRAWRKLCPELTIRSTFIVGFPGETDAEFEELLDFLDAAQLDRVGAFAYSPVDGAKANELPDAVPEAGQAGTPRTLHGDAGADQRGEAAAQDRHDRRRAGRSCRCATAPSRAPAPMRRRSTACCASSMAHKLKPGQFVQVRVEAADEHDLAGELARDPDAMRG